MFADACLAVYLARRAVRVVDLVGKVMGEDVEAWPELAVVAMSG